MKNIYVIALVALCSVGHASAEDAVKVGNGPVSMRSLPMMTAPASSTFSDPYYMAQRYFYTANELPNGLGIAAAQTLVTPYRPLRVGVIDGGFFTSVTDIPFVGGYDAIDNDDNPFVESDDCDFGHGTAVSAVIGASRNNGIGIAGVADVDIVPVRGLDCDGGYQADIVRGMQYLLSLEGTSQSVDVINLSLGGEGVCSQAMQDAINQARALNVPVVVAAGNASADASAFTPANCEGVITVGALAYDQDTGESRDIAGFSNYGDTITVSVQGESIVAPNKNDDDIVFVDGTSFSAPLVSGVLAMMKSQWPTMTVAEGRALLRQTTAPLSSDTQCHQRGCGAGRVQVLDTVRRVHAMVGGQRHGVAQSVLSEQSCSAAPASVYESLNSQAYCDTWEVTMSNLDGYQEEELTWRLHDLDETNGDYFAVSESATPLQIFSGSRGIMNAMARRADRIGAQRCINGDCDNYVLPIQTQLKTMPTYCF